MGVACGYVGEASVWAWLGVQCGGVASVWAWLVGVWVWPLYGCGLRCNVRAWSDVAWAWLSVCGRGLIVPI